MYITQDDFDLPREPVKLDLPTSLKQVLQRDRHLVKVKHSVTEMCVIYIWCLRQTDRQKQTIYLEIIQIITWAYT